ncbi:MAG: hypothetical protein K2X82_12895, partial [Gemmataceae bacterium]|nr:hypothetical protein [Gemmataceae bacterium]
RLPAEPPAAAAPAVAPPKPVAKPPAWKACFTVTHTAAVTAVAAADDMVVVADAESRLRLWDPADGHELGLRVYGVPGNCPIGALRFTTKAKYLVAECPPWAITRFDRRADRLRGGTFTGLWHGVAWSRDLDTVVCRRPDEPPDRVYLHNDLWNDPNGGTQPRAVVGPWDGVKVAHVALAADKPLLAVAGDDEVVRLIATDPVAERRVIEPGPTVKSRAVKVKLRAVALSDDGGRLAVVGDGGFAAVFDPATGKPVCPLTGHTGPVTKVTFDPAGKRVVTACGPTARVFDATTGRALGSVAHQYDITAVAFSTDGKRLVTGSADKTATVWEPVE